MVWGLRGENVGMWECGNMGMWEYKVSRCSERRGGGNVGMWECGNVGIQTV